MSNKRNGGDTGNEGGRGDATRRGGLDEGGHGGGAADGSKEQTGGFPECARRSEDARVQTVHWLKQQAKRLDESHRTLVRLEQGGRYQKLAVLGHHRLLKEIALGTGLGIGGREGQEDSLQQKAVITQDAGETQDAREAKQSNPHVTPGRGRDLAGGAFVIGGEEVWVSRTDFNHGQDLLRGVKRAVAPLLTLWVPTLPRVYGWEVLLGTDGDMEKVYRLDIQEDHYFNHPPRLWKYGKGAEPGKDQRKLATPVRPSFTGFHSGERNRKSRTKEGTKPVPGLPAPEVGLQKKEPIPGQEDTKESVAYSDKEGLLCSGRQERSWAGPPTLATRCGQWIRKAIINGLRRSRSRKKRTSAGPSVNFVKFIAAFCLASLVVISCGQEHAHARTPAAGMPGSGTADGLDQSRTLLGYDCGQPSGVTTVSARPGPEGGCDDDQGPGAFRNRTVKVLALQRSETKRIQVHACKVTRTRIGHLCWEGYDNQDAFLTDVGRFGEDVYVSTEECHHMWAKGKYRTEADRGGLAGDPFGEQVKINGTSFIWVRRAGWDQISGNRITCHGGSFKWTDRFHRNKYISNALVTDYLKVETFSEWAVVDGNGQIRLEQSEIFLPARCTPETGGCSVERHASVWWEPVGKWPTCPYYKARKMTGQLLTSADGQDKSFVATDGALFKADVLKAKSVCGSITYTTNHDGISITEETDNKNFNRDLHVSEMSASLMGQVAQQFFHERITEAVEEALERMRQNRCQRRTTDQETAYARRMAEHMAMTDGSTVHLGEGRFVTSAGEVLHLYTCRPVHVLAADRQNCYDSLPIVLSDSARKDYFSARGLFDRKEEIQFFLEPHSRRIKLDAIQADCVPAFTALYQTVTGYWIKATPTIAAAPSPTVIKMEADSVIQLFGDEKVDYNQGSIYSGEDISRMERFAKAGSSSQGLAAELTRHRLDYAREGDARDGFLLTGHSVFKELPKTDFSFLDAFGWLWDFLKVYSGICGSIMVTYLLFTIVWNVVSFLFRLFKEPVSGRWGHFIQAIFPAVGEFVRDPLRLRKFEQMGKVFKPKKKRKPKAKGSQKGKNMEMGSIGKKKGRASSSSSDPDVTLEADAPNISALAIPSFHHP